jgi:methyl-accepting chemotaxis protein
LFVNDGIHLYSESVNEVSRQTSQRNNQLLDDIRQRQHDDHQMVERLRHDYDAINNGITDARDNIRQYGTDHNNVLRQCDHTIAIVDEG